MLQLTHAHVQVVTVAKRDGPKSYSTLQSWITVRLGAVRHVT